MHTYVNSVISNGDKYVKTKYDVLKRDFRAANFRLGHQEMLFCGGLI